MQMIQPPRFSIKSIGDWIAQAVTDDTYECALRSTSFNSLFRNSTAQLMLQLSFNPWTIIAYLSYGLQPVASSDSLSFREFDTKRSWLLWIEINYNGNYNQIFPLPQARDFKFESRKQMKVTIGRKKWTWFAVPVNFVQCKTDISSGILEIQRKNLATMRTLERQMLLCRNNDKLQ